MRAVGWMLQAIVLGALLGVAAHLLERQVLRTRRGVWAAAMLLTAVVPFVALEPSWWPEWLSWRVSELPVRGVATVVWEGEQSVSGGHLGVNPVLLGWAVLSLLCASRYAAGWARLGFLSRGGRRVRIAGRELLVTERFGPAVVGLWRPRVVAPRWILSFSETRQRLIVMHELEHVRAGDHWLLAAAPLLALLCPWNVSLWWQLRRLRLAVELDCDARVLARGAGRLEYGELLLDVTGLGMASLVPALAERRSLLERRLEAVAVRSRRPAGGVLLATGAATVATAAGCLVSMPVRVIATAAASPISVDAASPVADAARGSSVASPETRNLNAVAATAAATAVSTVGVGGAAAARRVRREPLGDPFKSRAVAFGATSGLRGEPLFIVDGVLLSGRTRQLPDIERERIERVEVFKGVEARARYGARGEHGVVVITTRRGAADQWR